MKALTNINNTEKSEISASGNSRLNIARGIFKNPEILFQVNSLHKEDFKKVLCIILDKICKILHTDVNNSCFSLRMIFYSNFVQIMEQVVTYLD